MLPRLVLCLTVAASIAHADIFDKFLAAKPLYPIIHLPDIVRPEEQNLRVESINFDGTFNPLSSCSENKTLNDGDFGVITTPNYPKNYPGGLACEWNLEGPVGSRIEASFYDLYTQPWFFTYFDYVMISKDGTWTKVDRMSGDMNSKTPFLIVSESNKMGIRFRSSALFNFRGLKLQYIASPIDPVEAEKAFVTPFDGECGLSEILAAEDETTQRPIIPGVVPETPILIPGGASPTASPGINGSQTPGPQYWPPHIRVHGSDELASISGDLELDNNIIGPGQSPEGAFPWMVALLIDGKHFCGGSLIDHYHIITAAHCTENAKKIVALLGTNSLKNPGQTRKVYNITREAIFQHPSYNPNSITHDISILRIPERVEYTERIRPICLPNRFYNSRFFTGEVVRVSGWGKSADNSPSVSPVLKNTTIAVMSNQQCRTVFRGLVTGNLICTATRTNASPCQGDSGGPLFIAQHAPDGRPYYMQVGIVSFGGNSCQRAMPVGFTRITAFMEYISTITGRPF